MIYLTVLKLVAEKSATTFGDLPDCLDSTTIAPKFSKYIGHSMSPLPDTQKLRVAHAPGMPGAFFPPPLVSDAFNVVGGKTFPTFSAHAQPAIWRMRQEVLVLDIAHQMWVQNVKPSS